MSDLSVCPGFDNVGDDSDGSESENHTLASTGSSEHVEATNPRCGEGGAKNTYIHIGSAGHVHCGDVANKFALQNADRQIPSVESVVETKRGDEITNLTSGLKQKLKKLYNDITLPCVSWMEKGKDFVLGDYYVKLQLTTTSSFIKIEEIFNGVDGESPKRILIDGQPGFGKTTLTSKLIHDWAQEKPYLQKFDLAFLVPLRELDGRSIGEVLIEIAKDVGFGKSESVLEIIQENEHKVLLVFDGLDEVADVQKNDVEKILYGQMYEKMTVVVTCRTGCFTEKRRKVGGISVKSEFADKLISILGIGVKDRANFLKRFCQEDLEFVLKKLRKLTSLGSDLFNSPLMLILLSYYLVVKADDMKYTTTTKLYKNLVNFVIRRYLEMRKNIVVDETFSIFSSCKDELEMVHKRLFHEFGKLCLEKVVKRELQFEFNDLTKNICEMGFLTSHVQKIPFKSERKFEAIHLTLMEFAAAFALACEFRENNFRLNEMTLLNVIELHLHYYSPILSYLADLLDEKAEKLFQQIEPLSYEFTVSGHNLCVRGHQTITSLFRGGEGYYGATSARDNGGEGLLQPT